MGDSTSMWSKVCRTLGWGTDERINAYHGDNEKKNAGTNFYLDPHQLQRLQKQKDVLHSKIVDLLETRLENAQYRIEKCQENLLIWELDKHKLEYAEEELVKTRDERDVLKSEVQALLATLDDVRLQAREQNFRAQKEIVHAQTEAEKLKQLLIKSEFDNNTSEKELKVLKQKRETMIRYYACELQLQKNSVSRTEYQKLLVKLEQSENKAYKLHSQYEQAKREIDLLTVKLGKTRFLNATKEILHFNYDTIKHKHERTLKVLQHREKAKNVFHSKVIDIFQTQLIKTQKEKQKVQTDYVTSQTELSVQRRKLLNMQHFFEYELELQKDSSQVEYDKLLEKLDGTEKKVSELQSQYDLTQTEMDKIAMEVKDSYARNHSQLSNYIASEEAISIELNNYKIEFKLLRESYEKEQTQLRSEVEKLQEDVDERVTLRSQVQALCAILHKTRCRKDEQKLKAKNEIENARRKTKKLKHILKKSKSKIEETMSENKALQLEVERLKQQNAEIIEDKVYVQSKLGTFTSINHNERSKASTSQVGSVARNIMKDTTCDLTISLFCELSAYIFNSMI